MGTGIELGIAAIGAVAGIKGGIDAKKAAGDQADAQEKSEKTQQKIRDLQAARERRTQVRQARAQRAEMVAGSGAGGTLQSSSSITGAGSVGSQLGSNLSFLDQTQGLAQQASIFNIQAASAGSRVASGQALQSLGGSLFANSGKLADGATTILDKMKGP
jgi:hypothetical protein